MIIAVDSLTLTIGKKKAEENQGFNSIRTCDLRDTGVMLSQLSYEVTHWERSQLVEFLLFFSFFFFSGSFFSIA